MKKLTRKKIKRITKKSEKTFSEFVRQYEYIEEDYKESETYRKFVDCEFEDIIIGTDCETINNARNILTICDLEEQRIGMGWGIYTKEQLEKIRKSVKHWIKEKIRIDNLSWDEWVAEFVA